MQRLILTRGLPASGKSTWATEQVKKDPTIVRLNRDMFRQMLFGKAVLDSSGETMVTVVQHGAVDNALKQGFTVVVDDTNFFVRGVNALLKIAHKYDVSVEFKDFTDVPLNECIRRDEIRRNGAKEKVRMFLEAVVASDTPILSAKDVEAVVESFDIPSGSNLSDAVGKQVIQGMHDRYIRGRQLPLSVPTLAEYKLIPYESNPNLPDAVIVDIDGTIAKMADRSPYDWKRVGEDDPVQTVLDMVYALEQAGNIILFTSGRDGSCYGETQAWIHRYYHYKAKNWQLVMRAENDSRADWIIKAEIFDRVYRNKYNIKLVVDDRDQVVRMWRKLGLTVCQVAEGDF